MWRVQVLRNGTSHGDLVPQAVLPSQHVHGLPPKEHHVTTRNAHMLSFCLPAISAGSLASSSQRRRRTIPSRSTPSPPKPKRPQKRSSRSSFSSARVSGSSTRFTTPTWHSRACFSTCRCATKLAAPHDLHRVTDKLLFFRRRQAYPSRRFRRLTQKRESSSASRD